MESDFLNRVQLFDRRRHGGRGCALGRGRDRLQVLLRQMLHEPAIDHRHVLLVPLSLLINDPERLLDDGVRRLEFVLVVDVELGHHIVALLRVERRRGEVDDAVPEEGLVFELLLHGVPVLVQEVEQGPVPSRAAGQHTEDQVDVRVGEILVPVQHGHLQQSNAKRYYYLYIISGFTQITVLRRIRSSKLNLRHSSPAFNFSPVERTCIFELLNDFISDGSILFKIARVQVCQVRRRKKKSSRTSRKLHLTALVWLYKR